MVSFSTLFSPATVDAAVLTIRDNTSVQLVHLSTHEMVLVEIPETTAVVDATAAYLVHCIAQTIATDLSIVTELVGSGPDALASLAVDVRRRLGEDNGITDEFRQDDRDPWIAEAIGHLFTNISREHFDIPPAGFVHAVTPVHDDVKDHGFDLVALYEIGSALGLSISEAKASENNASNHAGKAAILFSNIEKGTRDQQIRGKVLLLRDSLPVHLKGSLTPGFWRDERCLIALLMMSEQCGFDCYAERKAFSSLTRKPYVIAIRLKQYVVFFNAIADRMRQLTPVPMSVANV